MNNTKSTGRRRFEFMKDGGKYTGEGAKESWLMASAISHAPGELFQVLAHQLRHLEHVDDFLPAEDRLQVVVRVDHALVLLVLEPVLLDVSPQLLRHLGARNRLRTDDF